LADFGYTLLVPTPTCRIKLPGHCRCNLPQAPTTLLFSSTSSNLLSSPTAQKKKLKGTHRSNHDVVRRHSSSLAAADSSFVASTMPRSCDRASGGPAFTATTGNAGCLCLIKAGHNREHQRQPTDLNSSFSAVGHHIHR
jgi:hypothetical protein